MGTNHLSNTIYSHYATQYSFADDMQLLISLPCDKMPKLPSSFQTYISNIIILVCALADKIGTHACFIKKECISVAFIHELHFVLLIIPFNGLS